MHGSAAPHRCLSLVIPAYNEEAVITAAVAEADAALARAFTEYEVLVVDDGSRDGTFAAASAAAAGRPNVRVLRHEGNRGYGAALRTGFEAARFDRVAFTDADCQFDLADLARMAPLADDAPIVAGWRIDRKDPWRRRFYSRGYNRIVRTLLGTRVRDCDCALKVFRRDAVAKLLPESRGFFVNTEMLTRARLLGMSIAEVGVTHRPRAGGTSKVSVADIPKTLAALIPFWWSKVMFPASPPVATGGLAWAPLLLVMAVAALLFFCRLGTPLLEPEEARYAEIPRQMLAEGRLVVPVLHGQDYLDKPPLLYWLVMASFRLFGPHDWAARLVPGLAGWLTVLAAYLWARRTAGERAAFLGAMVLCLSARFVYLERLLTMNGPLALFVTAAMACAHTALTGPTRQRGLFALAGLFAGLGLLTKGPVALVLPAVPLLLISRLDPRVVRPKVGTWLLALGVALLVAAPWYVAVSAARPEFGSYFFWRHNVVRYVRPFDHAGPVWEYVPGLLLGLLPWTLLLPTMSRFLTRLSARKAARRPAALGFFLLTFVWMFAFFSLAGSKRPAYVVSALPPLALAVGCYLDAAVPRRRLADVWAALRTFRSELAYRTAVAALLTGVVAGLAAALVPVPKPERALLVALGSGIGLGAMLHRRVRGRTSWAVAGAACFAVLLAGFHELLPGYARKFSLRVTVHQEAWRATDENLAIVCYPQHWDSVSFYTGRPVSAFGRENRAAMVDSLLANGRSLLFVRTAEIGDVRAALPAELEFVEHRRDGSVTVGEVRPRRTAGLMQARAE